MASRKQQRRSQQQVNQRKTKGRASGRSLRIETLEDRQMLTTYFVDGVGGEGPGGDNSNDGLTEATAFATIQQAVNRAGPGDTVQIRGGVYREQVNHSSSGTEGNPIVFESYQNEDVIVTATDLLTGFSPTGTPNVFVATLEGNANNSLLSRHELTVFVDGQVVQEAKSKNSADYLDYDSWETFNSASTTVVTDSTLIGSTDNLVGSFIRIRTSNFTLEDRRIVAFNSGNGQLTLDSPLDRDPGSGRYLLHDALDLVDSPGEWYFQEETNQFFLYAPGGGDPDNYTVEVKRRAEAFDTNGRDHLHFKDLTLTGGDFDLEGSDNLLLQGLHIIAPDRIFGPEFGTTRIGLNFSGDNNVLRDSELEQAWSASVRVWGEGNLIVNNFFHDSSFNGGGSGGIATTASAKRNLFSHNTFTRMGRSAIVGEGVENIIQHNDFSEVALLTEDTGAIYYNDNNVGNTIIRYNSFHNIDNTFGSGVYTDNNVTDLAVHHNLFYDVRAFGGKFNLPNSYLLVYNNTYFGPGNIDAFGAGVAEQISFGSRFYNNIYSSFDNELLAGPNPFDFQDNFQTTSSSNFVDANAGDFRLRSTSGAIDAGRIIPGITDGFSGAAPDAGAIEFGESLFAVGHDFASPPNPADYVFDFEPVIFSNRAVNGGFEQGLLGFTATGPATAYSESTQSYREDGLGRFGRDTARLLPGGAVSQTITGLQPNTAYTVTGLARIVGPVLQAEDASSGVPIFNYRNHDVRGQLQNGNTVSFPNVNFGTGTGRYNELQIGLARANSGTTIQVYLDSTSNPPIRTFNAETPDNFDLFNLSEISLPEITGTHNLILRFTGGSNLGLLDEIRLLDTTTTEQAQLEIKDFAGTGSISQFIGAIDSSSPRPKLEFRTGPESTSATIVFRKPAGTTYDAYIDAFTIAEAAISEPVIVDVNVDAYNYDVGTAFEPDALTGGSPAWELLSVGVTGDISWTGAVGAFDAGSVPGLNAISQDFAVGSQPVTLNHKVANGLWNVAVNLSSPYSSHDNVVVKAEGEIGLADTDRDAGQFITQDFNVFVTDGELNLEFSDADAINPEWTLNRLSLRRIGEAPFVVDTAQTEFRYDLGDDSSTLFDGTYQRLSHTATGDVFWVDNSGLATVDRGLGGTINNINRDLIVSTSGQAATLNHKVGNGLWQVLVTFGDEDFARDNMGVRAEGQEVLSNIDRAAGQFANEFFDVVVSDGSLSLEFFDEGGVNDDWSISRLIFTQITAAPELPGDFNGDLTVDASDYTVWRSQENDTVAPFTGADNDGDGIVGESDYRIWRSNYGRTLLPTELINATTGNGSFEDLAGATGTNVAPPLVLGLNATATIPGWTAETVFAAGWNGVIDGAASDGVIYAFAANTADLTLTSDVVSSHTTNLNDEFTIAMDVGSDRPFAHDYEVRLIFGSEVRTIATFSEATDVTIAGPARREFTYVAVAGDVGESPVVQIVVDNLGGLSQAVIDNIFLGVKEEELLSAAASTPFQRVVASRQIVAEVTTPVAPAMTTAEPTASTVESPFEVASQVPTTVAPIQRSLANNSDDETLLLLAVAQSEPIISGARESQSVDQQTEEEDAREDYFASLSESPLALNL